MSAAMNPWLHRPAHLVAALVAALLLSACAQPANERVAIENPWIREAPPTARALAGYMQLRNNGTQAVSLLFASSADFERIELHVTRQDNDRMRMEQVDHVALPPRETIEFAPGGLHLMLIGPRRELSAGARVVVELSFSDGAARDVVFPVRDTRPRP